MQDEEFIRILFMEMEPTTGKIWYTVSYGQGEDMKGATISQNSDGTWTARGRGYHSHLESTALNPGWAIENLGY